MVPLGWEEAGGVGEWSKGFPCTEEAHPGWMPESTSGMHVASDSDAGGTHSIEAYEMAVMAFILDGIHMITLAPPPVPQRANELSLASLV